MKLSIFGIGYVGCVNAGSLAKVGHNIVAVDPDLNKVRLINSGKPTIVEHKIDEYVNRGVGLNLIRATHDPTEAVDNSDVAIICVGTPTTVDGNLDMSVLYSVARDIGKALRSKEKFFTVAIRSTVMPGTNAKVASIIQEESSKTIDRDFAVVSNPEFLREGIAVNDFFAPPYTIVGSSSDEGVNVMNDVFASISAPFVRVDIRLAELIKFVNNSFHALKVSFSNEVGRICKEIGTDSQELMELFSKDTILNSSHAYLRPGPPYGGTCLPKDLKALNFIADENNVSTPILNVIDISNRQQSEYMLSRIREFNKRTIGVFGLAFKPGTNDLRCSPSLEMCKQLVEEQYQLKIFDENLVLSQLIGKNKNTFLEYLPQFDKLLFRDIDKFLKDIELLIFAHNSESIKKWRPKIHRDVTILDIVGIKEIKGHPNYQGITW